MSHWQHFARRPEEDSEVITAGVSKSRLSAAGVEAHCEATWKQAREGSIGRLLPLTYGVCPAGECAISLVLKLLQPSLSGLSNLTAMRLDPAQVSESVAKVLARLDEMASWDEVSINGVFAPGLMEALDREVVAQFVTFGLVGFRLEPVLAGLGKEEVLLRLRTGVADFRRFNLIG